MSVISTFADIPDVDDSGIGLMLEYNNLSVGYSWHGSDGVVTLNIDLAKVLADRPDSIEGWLEKLE